MKQSEFEHIMYVKECLKEEYDLTIKQDEDHQRILADLMAGTPLKPNTIQRLIQYVAHKKYIEGAINSIDLCIEVADWADL